LFKAEKEIICGRAQMIRAGSHVDDWEKPWYNHFQDRLLGFLHGEAPEKNQTKSPGIREMKCLNGEIDHVCRKIGESG
jgi:hypothetical protein